MRVPKSFRGLRGCKMLNSVENSFGFHYPKAYTADLLACSVCRPDVLMDDCGKTPTVARVSASHICSSVC